jgi:hypothetical protein
MHRSIRVCVAMAAAALVLLAGGIRPAVAQDELTPAWAQVLPKDAQVLVTWAAVTDATGYTVTRRLISEEIDKAVKVNANPIKETSLVDSGLTNGTTLIYSVQASFADGSMGDPIEAVGTPHPAILGKFQSYDIETLDPGGVTIADNVLTIRASGADIWAGEDGQTFLATPVTGDFTITMKLNEVPTLENDEVSDFAKVGLQAKAGLFPDSPYALVFASAFRDPEFMFEGRREQGGGGDWSGPAGGSGITPDDAKFPAVFRLTRRGNVFSAEVSQDNGATFQKVFDDQTMESATPEMYVGVAATAHNAGLYVNGKIDANSIQITTP